MQSSKRDIKKATLSKKEITQNLNTKIIGKELIFKETTTSTQHVAHELAKKGAEHGTIVIANEQTEARGRGNRSWRTVKDKAISMSIIIRPHLSPHKAPQLTLLTATVVAEVIEDIVNIKSQIKWPNDILLQGKKFVGILTEMETIKNEIDYIVIGIGMNVNYSKNELPKQTNYPTTSLMLETNKQWDIPNLIQHLLRQFEQSYEQYLINGFPMFQKLWESYAFKYGETLYINDFKNKWLGTLIGITEDGALLVKDKQDRSKKIYSAEIEWYNY